MAMRGGTRRLARSANPLPRAARPMVPTVAIAATRPIAVGCSSYEGGRGTRMQVQFWGTRGSIAKPGPDTVRYGGNTSCVQVTSAAGTNLVIDCGTGAHALGQALMAAGGPIKGHVLISHTHWDHIQGIPFFTPFFVPGNEWDFYAPTGFGESLRETLAGQMEYTYFPITPEAFGATIRYNNLAEGSFRIDDIVVHTRYLNHPALTIAFRIEVDGAVVVYACDHEPHSRDLAHARGPLEGQDRLHAEFLRNADLVIHDSQYLAEEYAGKVGWGHSTVEYAVTVAQAVGVKRLALTHHDPLRTDAKVDDLVAHAQTLLAPEASIQVFAAAEGMILDIVGDRAASDSAPIANIMPINALAASEPNVAGPAATLLMVTADDLLREKLTQTLVDEPLRPIPVADAIAALRYYRDQTPSVVLSDDVADRDGSLVAALRATGKPGEPTPVIVVGPTRPDWLGQADDRVEWLQSPFSAEYARSRIRTWVMRSNSGWLRAALPDDEPARLAALHSLGLLDTRPDDRFDRVARIAAELFDMPVVLVSLVDAERQWFKSCVGMEGTAGTETSRDVSFCAHAIHKPEPLVIHDALQDERFRGNPLVIDGPRIRFYAGTPLHTPDGFAIGTLCLIDHRPREFGTREVGLLKDLGAVVEVELQTLAPAVRAA